MLKEGLSFSLAKLSEKDGLFYSSLTSLSSNDKSVVKMENDPALDYIFALLRLPSFSYVDSNTGAYPLDTHKGEPLYTLSRITYRLPFYNKENPAEVDQWNDLVGQVTSDFYERKDIALRKHVSIEELQQLIEYRLEFFPENDAERLNAEKLTNLVIFVYDYCMLTMYESNIDPEIADHIPSVIKIGGRTFHATKYIANVIKEYLEDPFTSYKDPNGYDITIEKGILPESDSIELTQNPNTSFSCTCAMFVDLMHRFFHDFGLEHSAKTEWSTAEKDLIYELLRKFGLCNSDLPAHKSKYVTTVYSEYGDYFRTCNLHRWLRVDAYCYLLPCGEHPLFDNTIIKHE